MAVKNFYPKLHLLPYTKTSIDMKSVIDYLNQQTTIPVEVKRSAYVIFRNESANGKDGINNNYIGLQSDCGLWPEEYVKSFVGTTTKKENLTGKLRGFLCFAKWQDSVDILIDEVKDRGLYVGGTINSQFTNITDVTEATFCEAYEDLWVYGNKNYIPTKIEQSDFDSMYKQAKKYIK